MAVSRDYVFPLALTAAQKDDLQKRTQDKLTEMLGVEVDHVMAEYVLVMVGNKKSMAQIAHDLIDFIGDESAEQFVDWLSELLPTYEEQQAAEASSEAEPKRVKGSEASSGKKVVSLSGSKGTIRTLSTASTNANELLAKRSQRFGIVAKEKTETKGNKREREREEPKSNKRKATSEPEKPNQRRGSGGRLSQLLGPPVNADQADLDAGKSNKKKRGSRSAEREPSRNERRQDQENRDSDRNGSRRRNGDSQSPANPPLPPNEPGSRDGNRRDRGDRDKRYPRDGPFPGDFRGGPPGYGGFPPQPFGGPPGMFYPPPPFGMNPYGMGFPPQQPFPGQRNMGYFGGPPQMGGRGPRPAFQNRKWVNPNVAKAEAPAGEGSEAAGQEVAAGAEAPAPQTGAPVLNAGAAPFAPRNPYYANSQMRPRFQNKTWVRQDPAQDETLSSSLPQTPPQEELEAQQE